MEISSRIPLACALLIASLPIVSCKQRPVTAAFSFEDRACEIPASVAAMPGGPLTRAEQDGVEQLARAELARAFAGLRIAMADQRNAFWHVVVRSTVSSRGRFVSPLPKSGGSLALGPFGGTGQVGCDVVAGEAIHHAPPGATRETILAGIGRGVGRVAAHEFAHQITDGRMAHNEADGDSYEHPSADRASQYYGDLHWTTAWPLLKAKLGN